MAQDNDRPASSAVELDENDLQQAEGGFTPSTGADRMEFTSPADRGTQREFTPTTGADKMEFSAPKGEEWLF